MTADLGRDHVAEGSHVDYDYCPPASGNHYIVQNRAPLPRKVYTPADGVVPGDWLHNLEHGWVVIAYRSDTTANGAAASADELAAITAFYNSAPPTTYTPNSCIQPNKVIAVPFNDMSTKFAFLAWDRAELTDTFDPAAALLFYTQWVDSPQAAEHGIC